LDADFATEIHATIQRAVTMPLTNRFPYEALYALDGRSIYMLAVMPHVPPTRLLASAAVKAGVGEVVFSVLRHSPATRRQKRLCRFRRRRE